jgi:type II secretory pathway pseudopilin PulG
MKTGARPVSRAVGFTLIEVVCALAILIFLFGGVYGIANGALTLSRSSNEARTQELRLSNLDAMLRAAFEDLATSTQFQLEAVEDARQLTLMCEQGSCPLTWQNKGTPADRLALRLEPDPGKRGTKRLVIEHWQTLPSGQVQSIGKLPLLGGLSEVNWRLFDAQSDQWEDNWPLQKGRPLLAELTIATDNQPGPQRMVFWIPSYAPPQAAAAANSTVP